MIPKCFKNCLNFITIRILIMSMIPGAIALPVNNNPHIMDSNPASITELYVGATHEMPNQKYVKITNNGNEAVNMKGWKIKDECEKHTYIFSDFILKPKSTVTVRSGSGTNTSDTLY